MLIQVPQSVPNLKTATVRRWLRQVGQPVAAGEVLMELETEDALIQLQAPAAGVLTAISAEAGKTLNVGGKLGQFDTHPASAAAKPPAATASVNPPPTAAPSNGLPILMPQAGNTMEAGTITKWKVRVGDSIKVGQVICDIETDKATVEVEATAAGRIAWLAAEGSVVPVKQPIALLGEGPVVPASAAPAVTAKEAVPSGEPTSIQVLGGVTPLLMPQAGNTMEEGTIVKWRVKAGDRIKVGQIICEVETDKATVEVEATNAGRIAKIVAAEGAVVPVKQPIAYLAESDAAVADLGGGAPMPAVKSQKAEAEAPGGKSAAEVVLVAPVAARSNGDRIKASPAARKLAAQRGVDLATLSAGSGPAGRILSSDVAQARTTAAPAAAPKAATAAPAAALKEIAPAGPMGTLSGGRKMMSKMRRAIAVNLQTSKQTVPHFYVKLTINADPLFAFYRTQKPATGCTINDVILLAVGRVAGEMPALRSHLEGNDLVETPAANIGVAVSVEDGLVVPVVLNVHALTLAQLAVEAKRVVEAARAGKLENIGKGVFTISNMGMLGVEDFAAIINPPESGILAISAVREAVIVKDGSLRAGRVMSMTLSVDHRVVDGAMAAQFMGRLRELLENPEKLLG
jgi:pyruvate dehydrogenase E2 component (dihydrolipoamide acetyltransferase)